jgi:AcrR family transcriptional regulator
MPKPAATTPKKPRADAARNRDKILAAAHAAFAQQPEADVSMAEISRRAGVGMATLYRNFPGRRELLEALYTEEVDAMVAAAATVAGATPADRLDAWVRRFVAFKTGERHIAVELLVQVDAANPVFNANRDRVLAAGRPLLDAAQSAGAIRAGLTLEQILDMVLAIARIHGDADYVAPILDAALAGLRPPG